MTEKNKPKCKVAQLASANILYTGTEAVKHPP